MGLTKNIIFGVMLGTHKMIQLMSQLPTWQIVNGRYVFPHKPTITSLPLTMQANYDTNCVILYVPSLTLFLEKLKKKKPKKQQYNDNPI